MKKSYLTALLTVVPIIICVKTVDAALIQDNDPNMGAGDDGYNLTIDTDTGLKWLDLTLSVFRSYNNVAANLGVGGNFEGYRIATEAEVLSLWTNAGINYTGNYIDIVNQQAITDLIPLVGDTYLQYAPGSLPGALGWYDDTLTGSNPLAPSRAALIIRDSSCPDGAVLCSSATLIEENSFSLDSSNTVTGVWLIQVAQVPTPTDVYWNDPLGGIYSDSANWDRGSPPGLIDTSIFNLASEGYTVTFDSSITNTGLSIGNDIVTLDLGTYTYTLTGNNNWAVQLDAGTGTSDLTVKNGAFSTVKSVPIGASESLTIDGASWNDAGITSISGADEVSQAIFKVVNGAVVSTSGEVRAAYGTIEVDAANWINIGDLRLADSGHSYLNITNGGNLTLDGAAFLAGTTGSIANILVNGVGSTLNTTYLSMGGTGYANGPDGTTATLDIQQGGSVTIGSNAFLCSSDGSTSTITVDGSNSSFSVSGEFHVGLQGNAGMFVTNGASAVASSTFIGSQAAGTGNGNVLVSGTGSSLVNTYGISVGAFADGDLTIEQGGVVSNTWSYIGQGLDAPDAPDVQGTAIVDGENSRWINNSNLTVGNFGSGSLTIQNGGSVFSTGGRIASSLGNGSGSVVIAGTNSEWEIDGTILDVGEMGIGSLSIESGASLLANAYTQLDVGALGSLSIQDGTVTLGIGSTIFNSGTTILGGAEVNATVVNNGAIMVGTPAASIINGNLINNAAIKTTDTIFQVSGVFTNNGVYTSDPSTNIFVDVIVGLTGYFEGGLGDVFIITGDLTNNSTQNTLWSTDMATLFIDSPGIHNITLGSEDFGQYGSANNFNWGTLRLGSGVQLNLLDKDGNGAAMYVGHLELADGVSQLSSITSAYPIYYNAALESNDYLAGQDYTLSGGGTLTPGTYPLNTTNNNGDLNADGMVNAGDAVLALRILTGQIGLTQEYLERGDVAPLVDGATTSDGYFDLGDYLIIQRIIVNNIN